jgi:CRISPR/Cas system-associated endoribonuclease Cas2
MSVKRSFFSGKINEMDGEKVKRSFITGKIKRIGDNKVEYGIWDNEKITSVGGEKVKHSLFTREIKEAPKDYYKVKYIADDDERVKNSS